MMQQNVARLGCSVDPNITQSSCIFIVPQMYVLHACRLFISLSEHKHWNVREIVGNKKSDPICIPLRSASPLKFSAENFQICMRLFYANPKREHANKHIHIHSLVSELTSIHLELLAFYRPGDIKLHKTWAGACAYSLMLYWWKSGDDVEPCWVTLSQKILPTSYFLIKIWGSPYIVLSFNGQRRFQ